MTTNDTPNDTVTFVIDLLSPDPYSECLHVARKAIRIGITLQGGMSDDEHANLLAFEELIRMRDNS